MFVFSSCIISKIEDEISIKSSSLEKKVFSFFSLKIQNRNFLFSEIILFDKWKESWEKIWKKHLSCMWCMLHVRIILDQKIYSTGIGQKKDLFDLWSSSMEIIFFCQLEENNVFCLNKNYSFWWIRADHINYILVIINMPSIFSPPITCYIVLITSFKMVKNSTILTLTRWTT